MNESLNNSFAEENDMLSYIFGDGPFNLNTFGFHNNNNHNDINERPTGETLYIIEREPIPNEPQFLRRGRRRGSTGEGLHNKYSFDNLLRKSKGLIIKLLLNFLNSKIACVYRGQIGHGKFIKKLFLLKHDQISNANIDFNRAFLEKTLGEIFSADLSSRIVNYKKEHNKILIEYLKNEEDEEKKEFFNNLFSLTFLNCINYFRGTNVNNDKYVYMEGLKKFSDLEKDEKFRKKNSKEYIDCLKNFINEYENELRDRNGRRSRRNTIEEN